MRCSMLACPPRSRRRKVSRFRPSSSCCGTTLSPKASGSSKSTLPWRPPSRLVEPALAIWWTISASAQRPEASIILVEKTDRLYRNLKDWVTLDELDLEIHFAKENVVLSADSRSSEKFLHGIKVLMAKNYIDNLSEETRKGMTERAE
jgi:hypothetical protein